MAPVSASPGAGASRKTTKVEPKKETFELPEGNEVIGFDFSCSKTPPQEHIADLMSGGFNTEEVDIDMAEAVVEEFKPKFKLFPHQVVARRWMAEREDLRLGRRGGFLADDMGLGKTLMILARIFDGRRSMPPNLNGWSPVTLVICPAAIIDQWPSEIDRFCLPKPELNVIVHHGSSRTTDPEVLRKATIVITTYEVLKSEHSNYLSSKQVSKSVVQTKGSMQQALFYVNWYRVVLDEAQNIKNSTTKAAMACFELTALFKWAMTGTPIQNSVLDLYSPFHFLQIHPFSDLEIFKAKIATPLKNNGLSATVAMRQLHLILMKIMLRRTKKDRLNGEPLLDLPPRVVTLVDCPFSPQELEFYQSLATKTQAELEEIIGDKARSWWCPFVKIMRLRQSCDHPAIIAKEDKLDDWRHPGRADKCAGAVMATPKKTAVETPPRASTADFQESAVDKAQLQRVQSGFIHSAKIRTMLQLLRETRQRGEKVIIYSAFTTMLDIVEPFLIDAGVKFVRYDGSMSTKERRRAVNEIHTNDRILCILVSLKAGSTGLNLAVCNNVILLDSDWNPFVEEQAFDRAHRIGQELPVNIVKLVVKGTIEDRVLKIQAEKRVFAREALKGNKVKGLRLTTEETLAFFESGGGLRRKAH
ncbi:hypothetical protein HGRIS_012056 [Hohenbuehelia grisea]|uniref:Uncharacterized protein n=1 Tax=Hohenbuehelia grisea TaxID=104357 RepID=A0ABR3IR44_9AGAR